MLDLLGILILWIAYSLFEGFREAYYFSVKSKNGAHKNVDEHWFFASQRFAVVLISSIGFFASGLGWHSLLLSFGLCCVFPFFHDGMYYKTRNKLDGIYTKTWLDHSATSTAKTEKFLTPINRIVMLSIGIGIFAYEIIRMI